MQFHFRTPVSLPKPFVELSPQTHCLFLGSCFADEVGQRLKRLGVSATINPVGTLYNMESIRLTVSRWNAALRDTHSDDVGEPLSQMLYQGTEGLWHNHLQDSSSDAKSLEACSTISLQRDQEGIEALRKARVLCVTLGTNHLYRHRATGMVVTNCHKQPQSAFDEEVWNVAQIVDSWQKLLDELPAELQIVFTVSPYRYAKYGMHESQLSKATLLLAVAELCQRDARCFYFPAYEIVLDELRDYRFYAADMLHVSPVAADYIAEQFAACTFTQAMRDFSSDWKKLERRLAHRPKDATSATWQQFAAETEELRQELLRRRASSD
ncbi:MAG: GSCFA domain-containing protein [Bacteroidaceae bacterium]|nr:GSCFA domain-containing protein [Bacteroidaceae bacterium]